MGFINFNDLFKAGMAKSRYLGGNNSCELAVGVDVTTLPGEIRAGQAMSEDTRTGVPSGVTLIAIRLVTTDEGNKFYVGVELSGKFYVIQDGGTSWTLTYTHTDTIDNAYFYNYELYFVSGGKLHKKGVDNAIDDPWTGGNAPTLNIATFTSTGDFYPMHVLNDVLWIGTFNYLCKYDNGTFTENVVTLPDGHRMYSLYELGTDLLIGTINQSDDNISYILRYPTWGDAVIAQTSVNEFRINSFIPYDGGVIINAGVNGQFYTYDGYNVSPFWNTPIVRRDQIGQTPVIYVKQHCIAKVGQKTYFGLSTGTSETAASGIYSLSKNTSGNLIFIVEQIPTYDEIDATELVPQNMSINAISSDYAYIATTSGSTKRIEYKDLNNKYDGYIHFPVIKAGRDARNFKQVIIPYVESPDGCSIEVYYRKNYGTWTVLPNLVNDVGNQQYRSDAVIIANSIQYRLKFVCNANNSVVITDFIVNY